MKNQIVTLSLVALAFFSSYPILAQQGKDGVASYTTTTIVNIYTPVILTASAGTTTITVGSATGFSVGDLIYIIQMRGATVNANVNQWGNHDYALPVDTGFGKTTNYNETGNNEFAEIASINGNIITIDCGLKNSYNDSLGGCPNTQVIRVPRYTSLTLSGAGQITCSPWNGSTGGVVVIEVQGNTSLGAGTSINVAGMGFRGGAVINATEYGVTNVGANYVNTTTNGGGRKGESIVGDTSIYVRLNNGITHPSYGISCPLSECKGNVANGGGGGNGMNAGGGGGSNGGVVSQWNGMGNPNLTYSVSWNLEPSYPVQGSFRPTSSSGGGRGGYAFSSSNQDPTVHGPDSTSVSNSVWGSDNRHNDGGWGGIPLDYSTGRLFLGGGGGAGDENNKSGTSGGNGGGIVYLLSYGTVTGAGQIIADGATALNTNTRGAGTHGDDGAGGGGGGGTVFINSVGNIALTNTLAISAQGGGGGNYVMIVGATTSDNFGPGGGGGGGYVSTTNAVAGVNVNGGANGIVTTTTTPGCINNTKIATKFPPNGATSGGAGTVTTFTSTLTNFYLTANNISACVSSSATLSVTVNGTAPSGLSINWYTVSAGGTSVFTGNPYTFTAPGTAGTYTYYAGTCPGTYRIPVTLTVTAAGNPVLTFPNTHTLVCSGSNDTLFVSGASSYTWSANAGSALTSSVIVTPASNTITIYTVTGANTGACAGTSTTSISVTATAAPTISVTATSNTICVGQSSTLTASGSTSYTWSSSSGTGLSATTGSVVVATPTTNATYTVIGTNGGCTSTPTTAIITVNTAPTFTVNSPPPNCIIKTDTLTASNNALTYTWCANAGSVVSNSVAVTPSVTTIYTVTGSAANGCSSTAFSTVTINSAAISVSVTPSQNPICQGGTSTLTATGATTYTWVGTGLSATNASVVTANPIVPQTYTVSGSVGSCTATPAIITLTVNPLPSLSNPINTNPTFCLGDSTKLSLFISGVASTYSWTPSTGLSATSGTIITATPTTTTIYTVTATSTSGVCVATQTTAVTVNPLPVFTVPTTTLCTGNTATLTTTGGVPTDTYSWTPATNALNGNQSIVLASPTVTTTYTIVATGTTTCTYTTTASVTVNQTYTVNVTSNPTGTICAGSPVTLTASLTPAPTSASSYTLISLAGITFFPGNTYTVSPTTTTTYSMETIINNCPAISGITTIDVSAPPIINISSSLPSICLGDSAVLTATGASSYIWSPATGLSTTTGSVVIAKPTATVTYSITGNPTGCPGHNTIPIDVHNITPLTISPSSATICNDSSATLTTSSGLVVYNWKPTSSSTGSVNVVSPSVTTTYSVTGMDAFGCLYSTATAIVNVITCSTYTIIIPNVFSPNGDAINDDFEVKANGVNTFTCDIYDRWGLKLYTFDSTTGFWDGTYKGAKEPDGTYFYVIQTRDTQQQYHHHNGFFQLIR